MQGLNLPKLFVAMIMAASVMAPLERTYAIEEDAERIMQAMSDYLKSAGEFSFHADISYDEVLSTGEKVKYRAVSDLSVRRPDRLLVSSSGDEFRRKVYFDGSALTLLNEQKNFYAVTDVPGKLDDALDLVFDKYGLVVPLADFLYADPYAVLTENAEFGSLLGEHACGEKRCHHLLFTQELIDWQIWIEAGTHPVPRGVVITYKDEPDSPQFEARFSRWNFQPRLSEHGFTFQPPDGAVKIDFLPGRDEEAQQ